MTIKDILDTPISEMWSFASPFVALYLIVGVLFIIFILTRK